MDDLIIWGFAILVFLGIVYSIIAVTVEKIKEPYESKAHLKKYEKDLEEAEGRANDAIKEAYRIKKENAELKSKLRIAELSLESAQNNIKEAEKQTTLARREAAYTTSERKQLFIERQELRKKYNEAIAAVDYEINRKTDEQVQSICEKLAFHPELVKPFSSLLDLDSFQKSIMEGVLQHAFEKPPKIERIEIKAVISSSTSNRTYNTNLSSCNCPDHGHRRRPCKHMLYLSYLLGLLQIEQKSQYKAVEDYNELGVQISTLRQEIKEEKKLQTRLEAINTELINVINETPNAYPRIAGMIADIVALQFKDSELYLRHKRPHASKAADEVSEMRKIVHSIVKRDAELEKKLETLVYYFPNFNDIFDKNFRIDNWELEVPEDRDPNAREIKDYLSKHINTLKYLNAKNQ